LYYDVEDPELAAKFAWAVPDERAIRVLLAHSPLVEIGSGRGYWGRLVADGGGIMHCYDINPEAGGTEAGAKTSYENWCPVARGGPESINKHADCALFLCYPDDFEAGPESMAEEAIQLFEGDTVIHVGELMSTGTKCKPGAFGKTTAPEAQVYLADNFHCVLSIPLPSWSSSSDYLTVWKRTQLVEVGEEEGAFAYVPAGEIMRRESACEDLKHLLE
jgi:hypothetical protein